MRDGVLPYAKWWPVHIDGGYPVQFVLRQWAEESAGKVLATALARSPGWRQVVLGLQSEAYHELPRRDDADLAAQLRDFGLPDTPGTIHHLRAVAADEPQPPLPTRGLLVTTMVRSIPPHSFTVSGELDTATAALIQRAVATVVIRHRAFAFDVVGRAIASDLQRVALDADRQKRAEVEYVAAAWQERDLLLVQPYHPNGIEGALIAYLNTIYKRVRERRQGAGMTTKPPVGWRDEIKPKLRDWLRVAS
jgi:hypothetical protein